MGPFNQADIKVALMGKAPNRHRSRAFDYYDEEDMGDDDGSLEDSMGEKSDSEKIDPVSAAGRRLQKSLGMSDRDLEDLMTMIVCGSRYSEE
jgi:hypothetical protein